MAVDRTAVEHLEESFRILRVEEPEEDALVGCPGGYLTVNAISVRRSAEHDAELTILQGAIATASGRRWWATSTLLDEADGQASEGKGDRVHFEPPGTDVRWVGANGEALVSCRSREFLKAASITGRVCGFEPEARGIVIVGLVGDRVEPGSFRQTLREVTASPPVPRTVKSWAWTGDVPRFGRTQATASVLNRRHLIVVFLLDS